MKFRSCNRLVQRHNEGFGPSQSARLAGVEGRQSRVAVELFCFFGIVGCCHIKICLAKRARAEEIVFHPDRFAIGIERRPPILDVISAFDVGEQQNHANERDCAADHNDSCLQTSRLIASGIHEFLNSSRHRHSRQRAESYHIGGCPGQRALSGTLAPASTLAVFLMLQDAFVRAIFAHCTYIYVQI